MAALITEHWLQEVGFKWHWFDTQPNKHWLLWLGHGLQEKQASTSQAEDLGIELSFGRSGKPDFWLCWLRTGLEHTYSRSIHIRHLTLKREVVSMVEGLTGTRWNPGYHYNGSVHTPRNARRER